MNCVKVEYVNIHLYKQNVFSSGYQDRPECSMKLPFVLRSTWIAADRPCVQCADDRLYQSVLQPTAIQNVRILTVRRGDETGGAVACRPPAVCRNPPGRFGTVMFLKHEPLVRQSNSKVRRKVYNHTSFVAIAKRRERNSVLCPEQGTKNYSSRRTN